MSDCEKYFDLISAYIDGELSASEEDELKAHLASCKHCRAVYDTLAGLSDELGSDLAEPPEDLTANVMAAVRAESGYPLARAAKEPKKRRAVIIRRAALAAACLAVVIFAVPTLSKLGRMGSSGSVNNAAPSASVSASLYSMKADEAYPAETPMMAEAFDGMTDAAAEETEGAVYESEPAANSFDSSGMKAEQPADAMPHDDGYPRTWDEAKSEMDGGYDIIITITGGFPEYFEGYGFSEGGDDIASYAVIPLEEAERYVSSLSTYGNGGEDIEIERFDAGTGLALVLIK